MEFNQAMAQTIAENTATTEDERSLIVSFTEVCCFLSDNPTFLSWRGKKKPSVLNDEGLNILAQKYFDGYRKSDFPAIPQTIPDEIVSVVMQVAYGYSEEQCNQIKLQHQHSMCAENCVGALLERYLDSVLRSNGWHWCCGNFVKAIDFIRRNDDGTWLPLQIKNRDNSENSSSSAIRNGTPIQKWFRSFSKTGKTNWDNLPPSMQGYSLNEQGFINFVRQYLDEEKRYRNSQK
ncbi:SinI family restriction endonuclease [Crocosphaera chwakensis]|uniref:Type II site-specific deoxyribonuclease n=1 Tax=Crocosphaera chwakensis CCY0110 TaxID=391612 RepID=A3IS80_9CHRO|nr:SinI family restriction endonuclease [Crocosphaera chwakensis]EAZ90596.1 type II site-specific deoxyribonuclease [Crocosphaera chwakensis CCY0110]